MTKTLIALLSTAGLLAACSLPPSQADVDKASADMLKTSFQPRGIAPLDRLEQDQAKAACVQADVSGKPLDAKLVKAIEEANMKTIKWPADGKFLGDWKAGERVAQTGVGMQWSDNEKTVNGGNCYACHQLSPQEVSFGNIGPSLKHYGKLRGNSEAVVKYTWGKIWNTHAFNACSSMPRFGDAGILTETQIKDVMALLLDPNSPVNK
mgnify:CR=1 FL=1